MHIEVTPFVPDREVDLLVDFLTGDEWPYHAGVQEPDAIRRNAADGRYDDEENRTFWILADGERAGLIRLQDLADDTPMFDLRIRGAARGKGLGTAALTWLTDHLFTAFKEVQRIEGTTRQDNRGMRAVFRKAGYVKEAHYRESWPDRDGVLHDTVGYAVLRRDWETGTVTLPDWDDEAR